MPKKVVVNGKVFSGTQQGKKYVDLPWVKKQIEEKLGFKPFIGTLNLRLQKTSDITGLHETDGITITPEKGYCTAKCFKARVNKRVEGAVVLPDVPDYPEDVLELLATVNLRKTFNLTDGDTVEVVVTLL